MSLEKQLADLKKQAADLLTRKAAQEIGFRRLMIDGAPFHRYPICIEANPEIDLPEVAAKEGETNGELIDRADQLIKWPDPKPGEREVVLTIFLRTSDTRPLSSSVQASTDATE